MSKAKNKPDQESQAPVVGWEETGAVPDGYRFNSYLHGKGWEAVFGRA